MRLCRPLHNLLIGSTLSMGIHLRWKHLELKLCLANSRFRPLVEWCEPPAVARGAASRLRLKPGYMFYLSSGAMVARGAASRLRLKPVTKTHSMPSADKVARGAASRLRVKRYNVPIEEAQRDKSAEGRHLV